MKTAIVSAINTALVPTIGKGFAAKFKNVEAAGAVRAALAGFPDAMMLRPSDVKISGALARAGMGEGASLESILNVLAHAAVMCAHGTRADDLAARHKGAIPQWMIARACAAVKLGAGVSAGEVRAALVDVLTAIKGAPVKVTETKSAAPVQITAPAPASEAPASEKEPETGEQIRARLRDDAARRVEKLRETSRAKFAAHAANELAAAIKAREDRETVARMMEQTNEARMARAREILAVLSVADRAALFAEFAPAAESPAIVAPAPAKRAAKGKRAA